MALIKRGSLKLTDNVLVTSVNLASEVTGALPISNIGNISTSKLLGRYSSGSGVVEEITISTGLSLDGSGNLTATGSGSGTVSSGTAKQLAYYAANGTTVSGLSTANSGVLVTSGSGDPSISTDIPTAVTIGSSYIYRAGGTDVPVSDGGTGLSSGTSGGVPYFSSSTTIASSSALAANQLVIGGGDGAAPATLGSLGTSSTVLHGNASGAPSFGAVAASDLASAIQVLFAQVSWGTPGAESSNAIEVQATVQDVTGTTLAAATTEIEVVVTDSATDCEPSATATLSAAGTPVGTLLGGSGTATAVFRTNSSGLFTVKVSETAAADRFLWVRQGPNSQAFCRATASPKTVSFT